jgi:predicted nucleic acid-binding protein
MSNGEVVLLDSDAFIGLLVATDVHHERVEQTLKLIDAHQGSLATTNFVIVETATGLSRRHHQATARNFLTYIHQSNFQVFYINEALHEATETLFLEQPNNATSMVDCANVVVSQAYNISTILSFDRFYEKFDHLKMVG